MMVGSRTSPPSIYPNTPKSPREDHFRGQFVPAGVQFRGLLGLAWTSGGWGVPFGVNYPFHIWGKAPKAGLTPWNPSLSTKWLDFTPILRYDG